MIPSLTEKPRVLIADPGLIDYMILPGMQEMYPRLRAAFELVARQPHA
jgi:hypothetical protein